MIIGCVVGDAIRCVLAGRLIKESTAAHRLSQGLQGQMTFVATGGCCESSLRRLCQRGIEREGIYPVSLKLEAGKGPMKRW